MGDQLRQEYSLSPDRIEYHLQRGKHEGLPVSEVITEMPPSCASKFYQFLPDSRQNSFHRRHCFPEYANVSPVTSEILISPVANPPKNCPARLSTPSGHGFFLSEHPPTSLKEAASSDRRTTALDALLRVPGPHGSPQCFSEDNRRRARRLTGRRILGNKHNPLSLSRSFEYHTIHSA